MINSNPNPFIERYNSNIETPCQAFELSDIKLPDIKLPNLIDQLPKEIVKEILKLLETDQLLELLQLKNKNLSPHIITILSERGGSIYKYASTVFNKGFKGTFFIDGKAITLPDKLTIKSLYTYHSTRDMAFSFTNELLFEFDPLNILKIIEQNIEKISVHGNTQFCAILNDIQKFYINSLDNKIKTDCIKILKEGIKENEIHISLSEKLHLAKITKENTAENKIAFLQFKIYIADTSDETKNLISQLKSMPLELLQQKEVTRLSQLLDILSRPLFFSTYVPRIASI